MATVRRVATIALRKAHEIMPGDTPGPHEAGDTLETLQSLYDEMITTGRLGRLKDIRTASNIASTDEQPLENVRIVNTSGGAITVTRPTYIYDPAGTDAEDGRRPPLDRSVILQADATPVAYVYSAPRRSWDRMSSLTLNDYAPLSERSLDGLATLLAARIVEEYGGQVTPVMASVARGFLAAISTFKDTERSDPVGVYY